MRKLALAVLVGLLTFSVSGVTAVMFAEPCAGYDEPACADASCAPTCVTCGCCAQAVDLLTPTMLGSSEAPVVESQASVSRLPKTDPHDILHVPKPLAA